MMTREKEFEVLRAQIIDYMEANNLSQNQFGKLSGIGEAAVDRIVDGEQAYVKEANCKKIRDALNVSWEAIGIDINNKKAVNSEINRRVLERKKANIRSKMDETEKKIQELKSYYDKLEKEYSEL